MEVARRILREFWLPTLVSAAWTAFNVYTSELGWDLKTVVNVFGPSFFLASWATGQFFRVKKQAGVERNLQSIETRISNVVDRLEKQSTDLLGYATGGQSWAKFLPVLTAPNTFELFLINESPYPVFDIQAQLIDLDEEIDPANGKFWKRHYYTLANLYPNKVVMHAYRIDMTARRRLRVNVFLQTRSRSVTQEFRIERVENWFAIASRTRVEGEPVEEVVPENFPGRDRDSPSQVFE